MEVLSEKLAKSVAKPYNKIERKKTVPKMLWKNKFWTEKLKCLKQNGGNGKLQKH